MPTAGLLQRAQLAGGAIDKGGVNHRLLDNAFIEIADWSRAQHIADAWHAKRIHWKLDQLAKGFCPIYPDFGVLTTGAWTKCEYATDIVFRRACGPPDPAAHFGRPLSSRRVPRAALVSAESAHAHLAR